MSDKKYQNLMAETVFYRIRDDRFASRTHLLDNKSTMLFKIRSYVKNDYKQVKDLLISLSSIYPDSEDWLEKKIKDVIKNKARCTVCEIDKSLIGLTIETPKKRKVIKLSTIFVHPSYRRKKIGSALLEFLRQKWFFEKIERVYGTADLRFYSSIYPFLSRFGFKVIDVIYERYTPGNKEFIYETYPSIKSQKLVLMSIHTDYVNSIYLYKKKYEFRRCLTNIKEKDIIFIYEPKPIAMITGHFTCGEIITGFPSQVYRLENLPRQRQLAKKYTLNSKVASAIKINFPFKWEQPVSMSYLFPDKKPPQSYTFI